MRRVELSETPYEANQYPRRHHPDRRVQDARISGHAEAAGHPVVITQRGRPTGVLITAAEFDRLTERDRFIAAVNEGLADSNAGRVISDDELSAELDRRYGPLDQT